MTELMERGKPGPRPAAAPIPELVDAIGRYIAAHPASRAQHERAQASMPGGNTRTALHVEPFPLYLSGSRGATVADLDGATYLDVLGEYTAGLYGHADPVIRAATIAALDRGASNGGPGAHEVDFADLLCRRFPSLEKVRFCNSGTEANLFALTLARIATGRETIVAFAGAYHGGALSFARDGEAMNAPFPYRIARYNDDAAAGLVDRDTAAVIIEPMMTNGGCIPARPSFLATLRARCDAVGAVLIFDEVVTSRMSAGGLQERFGVVPDLTTLGKYLGAGFSFGAFGGRADLLDRMDPGRADALPHAGTFNNNVFSMSVGLAALGALFTPARAERLFADGETLRARLNDCALRRQAGVQFTGCGSVMNIHFKRGPVDSPEDLVDENGALKRLFYFDMLEAGLYPAARGQINLSLPMGSVEFAQIESAVDAFLERRGAVIARLAR